MKTIRIMDGKEFEREAARSKAKGYGRDDSPDFYFAESVTGPPRISRKGSRARLDQFGKADPVVMHLGE